MSYFFITVDTEKTFIELPSLFASLASCYSAASAIHANASSISGAEVGTSTIDVFKTQSTWLLSIRDTVLRKKNYSLSR